MTEYDVKNYLEKIYKVPVLSVRCELIRGIIDNDNRQCLFCCSHFKGLLCLLLNVELEVEQSQAATRPVSHRHFSPSPADSEISHCQLTHIG